jgi:hypothetical protein
MGAFLYWGLLVVACVILLAPLLLVDVPPLLDYPNHLARLTVLASDVASPFYTPHWRIMPDLGIDVPGTWLLRHLPVHIAGRLIIGAVLLVSYLGPVAYGRVVLGRSGWPIATALVVYHETFLLGFLNFTLGVGLAFLIAAIWLRCREDWPWPTVAFCATAAIPLFFCHLIGVLCLALVMSGHEAQRVFRSPRRMIERMLMAAAVFTVPAVLYLLTDLHDMASDTLFLSPLAKINQMLVPFVNYNLAIDIGTAAVVVGMILYRRQMPARGAFVLGLTLALYIAAPFGFKGTYNLDTRFAIILGFLLFTCVAPRINRIVGLAIAALFVVRMGIVAEAWHAHARDIAELRAVIADVPPGSAVFVATAAGSQPGRVLSNGLRTDTHVPALLVIERHAWWPFLFDNPSQQPIETREPYRSLAERVGGMPDWAQVPAMDLSGFDHLLLLNADTLPDLRADGRLILMQRTGYAALFRVAPQHRLGQDH